MSNFVIEPYGTVAALLHIIPWINNQEFLSDKSVKLSHCLHLNFFFTVTFHSEFSHPGNVRLLITVYFLLLYYRWLFILSLALRNTYISSEWYRYVNKDERRCGQGSANLACILYHIYTKWSYYKLDYLIFRKHTFARFRDLYSCLVFFRCDTRHHLNFKRCYS